MNTIALSSDESHAYTPKQPVTREELMELEAAPKTLAQKLLNLFICLLPAIVAGLTLVEYILVPNFAGNETTNLYIYFMSIWITVLFLLFIIAVVNKKVFAILRYKAPFYAFIFLLFIIYDYMTLKTGILILPYFPWVDQILNAFKADWAYLIECSVNSLILLFTGYFIGSFTGIVTGIACGYSKSVNYWISPFMKLLGAIPSTTWIPVVMVLATSLFSGSVFIIALGVWFSLTIATLTGISNVDKSYFEAARILGASGNQLVFRVALPFAIPNIMQGLTQGLSTACISLLVAEMIGVESGLGWYIVWQKSWALYSKMYAAIILICFIFISVTWLLGLIKKRILRWQEGVIQ